ncbi:hypothetical protein BCV70DRAFT_202052 [Testicularia cyperi]|uniref:S-adenosyl-L-methionine-dependent methyltransferase n=1 Tax=Testicularia cyperi TaxID=1882483 RepID=A0A317XJL2_9BASI|nr:hypothetical protein BCV70DRAFT_202052 [Testicularia cyperi]
MGRSALPGDLQSAPARPAGPLDIAKSLLEPIMINAMLLFNGLPGAVCDQIRHPNPINLINPFHWQSLILTHGFAPILSTSNLIYSNIKRPVLQQAYGKTLEVGAGSGENIAYYNPQKIERLVCMEPYAPLRVQLEKSLDAAGLVHKTTVVPLGLELSSRPQLLAAGLEPGSFDTIVLVQVLCSVQSPKDHLEFLQSLLKPGGQILLFEHIASKHQPARLLQNIWTPFWRSAFGGCELNRDSADWVRNLGGWEYVDIKRPAVETTASLLPHAVARFVKAK